MMTQASPSGSVPTTELVENIYNTARELGPIEYELAKTEFVANITTAKRCAVLGMVCVGLTTIALGALVCLVVVSSSSPAETALWLAGSAAVLALVSGFGALRLFPTFLVNTRRRAAEHVAKFKEALE
jgi:hypothetical protein